MEKIAESLYALFLSALLTISLWLMLLGGLWLYLWMNGARITTIDPTQC